MSADDSYKGYRGEALAVLKGFNAMVWSDVEVHSSQGVFIGIILPRSETADPYHIVLKLRNGYNVGIAAAGISNIVIAGRKEAHYKIPEKDFPFDPKKPRVKLLGTGGTIASRLDYRTGAVIPAFSPGELYGSVPELADICNLEPKNSTACSARTWGRNSGGAPPKPSAAKSPRGSRGSSSGTAPTRCTTPPPSSRSWSRIRRCPS